MDQSTASISSSRKQEESGMEEVSSDMQALKRLYDLFRKDQAAENVRKLDETSRALMMKLLDDYTQVAVLRQVKMVSGSPMSLALERKLSIRSDRRTTQDAEPRLRLNPRASPSPSLQASDSSRWLNLQTPAASSRDGHGHRHAAAEEPEPLLDRLASNRSSRTAAMPPRHHPSQEQRHYPGISLHRPSVVSGSPMSAALERKLSIRSDRRTHGASLQASDSSRWLNMQTPTAGSSRSGGHAAEEPPLLLARLASNRSSATATPPRRHPSREQRHYPGLSLHRPSVPATSSQHGTVAGSSRHAGHQDTTRRGGAGLCDQYSSLKRSSSSSKRRPPVFDREPSLGPAERFHGRRATAPHPHVEAETEGSSTRRCGRLDSGLSAWSMASMPRRGSERAGRGVATPRYSSASTSSSASVTIRSRIRPNRELLMGRRLRRAEEEEMTPRRNDDGAVSSAGWSSSRRPRRPLKRIDSGSMYSSSSTNSSSASGAASSFPSTSPSVWPASSASASSCPSPVSRRRSAWPAHAPEAWPAYAPEAWPGHAPAAPELSRERRRRERRERLERRVGRLRKLKEKVAAVFHHRHDHHHHHHVVNGLAEDPSRSDRGGALHRMSPWRHLRGVFHFHRDKGHEKKTTSRTAEVGVPAKKRSGGVGQTKLYEAMQRHLRRKKRPPAGVKLSRTGSRLQAKKLHWWQRLRRRQGRAWLTAGKKPRRRLGHGKAL